jgi:putative membrane protein
MQRFPGPWSFDPPIILGLLGAALLYTLGLHASPRPRRGSTARSVAFAAGLALILVALESPLDAWAERLLWVHMVQHELLVMAAAPLLLLGAPALPLLRAVPLSPRRAILRRLLRRRRWCSLAHPAVRLAGSPLLAWLAFTGDFTLWHVPLLYDLAVRHQTVHDLEHLCYLATALLFWAQLIPSPPWRPRCSPTGQAIFLGAAAAWETGLDLVFILAGQPLYPSYATLARGPGMISALTDQSIAGGIMDGWGMATFFLAFLLLRRPGDEPRASPRRPPAAARQRRGRRRRYAGRKDRERTNARPVDNRVDGSPGRDSLMGKRSWCFGRAA